MDQLAKQTSLQITGMTCATCVQNIETALNGLDGVMSASVNLATEKAYVHHNPEVVTIPRLKKAISDTGYKAVPADEKAGDYDRQARDRERRRLVMLLIFSFSLAIPVFVLSMVMPFKSNADKWLLLGLTTPVQFLVGWPPLPRRSSSFRQSRHPSIMAFTWCSSSR